MNACAICHRPLSDAASRGRGPGPGCWTSILDKVHRNQTRETPLGPFAGNVILVRVDGKPYANVPYRFKPLHCEEHAEGMSWGSANVSATTLALNILSQFLPPYHVDKVGDLPSPEADVLAPYFAMQFLVSASCAGCIILQRDILTWLSAQGVPAAEIRTFGVLA